MLKVGVDAGGSLIKISYEEAGHLHVKTYCYEEKTSLTAWLQMLVPDAVIYGTGGKWPEVQQLLKQKTYSVDEFNALIKGTNYLLESAKLRLKEYILVSIGTGTSTFHVKNDDFERVLGSGIGGGTWMGLGSLLSNQKTFFDLVEESTKGNREHSDLLVKDIYGEYSAPLSSGLTAANFGKAHLQGNQSEADHLQALTQLIAEVILSLTRTVAADRGVREIAFIGSTVQGNKPLQNVLSSFQNALSYEPIFLERGAYAGAIGAMLG